MSNDPANNAEPVRRQTAGELIAEMRQGVPEALDRAMAAPSEKLQHDAATFLAGLRRLREQGEYGQWFDGLYRLGCAVEQWGRESELQPDFWPSLAFVAQKLQYPEMIPFAKGKTAGLPCQNMCDNLAAIVVIHREVGIHWGPCFSDRATMLDDFVKLFAEVDTDYPALFATANRSTIAARLEADGWLADPCPAQFDAVRTLLRDLFDPLFQFVHGDGFPQSLAAEYWSIVGFNVFEIRTSTGLLPFTRAFPWWY